MFDVGFHSRACCDRMVVFISRFGLHLGSKEEVLRGCGILSCLLVDGGIALGMFEQSTYGVARVTIQPDELIAIYSDGITEAESPSGRPFDESGLEATLAANRGLALAALGASVVRAVEQHSVDTRLADDLTILLLRRSSAPAAAGV